MSENTIIPLTVTSPIYNGGRSAIHIGTGSNLQAYYPSGIESNTSYYWFVAIDRRTLKVAHEVVQTDYTSVPTGFKEGGQYNNINYILVFSTMYMNTLHVPQGELFDFLTVNGAGYELQRLEQVFLQLNCGTYGRMAYSLVDLLGFPGRGIEEGSILNSTVSTLSLLGQDIDGKMLYTPIPLTK